MSRTNEPSAVEQLIDGIRAKMEGKLSSEPCTESALDAAEQALGFKLPALFRRLYGTLGDGVWPGTPTLAEIVDTSRASEAQATQPHALRREFARRGVQSARLWLSNLMSYAAFLRPSRA